MSRTEQRGTAPDGGDLTRFQMEICYLLAASEGQSDYGLGLKRKLEAYYGEEVNHGRLYPNLDALVEAGYVAKRRQDKRTNTYELSDAGAELVQADAADRADAVDQLEGH
ncbi:helix-turn-helix transcriptional regulator [Halomicroarcula sp. GCM10025709]|uniref:helix-turn-helix transcriptional regulator n=1 Tax=Haloarcula TaxID=2237 RepID=UPI0024C2BCEC|nr:helix-turn-helix transcriptional regulator [Halomicroarcula sp. YJ-61-S]